MDIEQKYQSTLEYLYGFVDYSLVRGLKFSPEKFNLQRMRDFVEELGYPQLKYPIIHVAGTKGKGSVAAFCASTLQAQGYKVGLYTSPHLFDYAERIQINGKHIAHEELVALVDEIRPLLDRGTELTTFEITTALAMLYFARHQVSAVVLEVGLGGRLDATNIVYPKVSVITSISLDHISVLGDTLEAIAAEKAGIIKTGIPVVVSPQKESVQQVISQIAAQKAAPLTQVGRDFQFELKSYSLDGQVMEIWQTPIEGHPASRVELRIPLLGAHQVENAATAYAVLKTADKIGLPVSEEAIRRGFAAVSWPGRFEILRRQPPIVVDSAHNRDSAHRLQIAMQDYFPGKPVILVFGASEDKDIQGMFAELLPYTKQMIVTQSFHPRAANPQDLQHLAEAYGCQTSIAATVADALHDAQNLAGTDGVVLVAGSIFIAAEAREAWAAVEK